MKPLSTPAWRALCIVQRDGWRRHHGHCDSPFLASSIPRLQCLYIRAFIQIQTLLPFPDFCSPFSTSQHSCTTCVLIIFHPVPHHPAEGDLNTKPWEGLYGAPASQPESFCACPT